MSWVDVDTDERLTHHDVLHDRQQHHLFKYVFHQDETRKVFKNQLLEARKLLWVDRKSLAQHVSEQQLQNPTECATVMIFPLKRPTFYHNCYNKPSVVGLHKCMSEDITK